jgi:vacuolar-type H+-ATPase subunit H
MAAPIVEPKPDVPPVHEAIKPEPPKPEPEPVHSGGLGMGGPSGEDNMDTAARVLALAQQTADQAIADARREADETLGRARREAEEILGKARRQADQVMSEARSRAEGLDRDAQERHRQVMGSLVQQREELERKVDDLRAFEREYRSRLKVYLEGQLRELEVGATEGVAFGGPGNTGAPAGGMQHNDTRNGQPNLAPSNVTPGNVTPNNVAPGNVAPSNVTPGNVAPSNTGPNPFPPPPAEPAQHAQHSGTGGPFHTADNPPHDRR